MDYPSSDTAWFGDVTSPSRLTPSVGSAPTAELPARGAWLRTPLMTSALTMVSCGALPLAGMPELVIPAGAVGAGATGAFGYHAWRQQRRTELIAALREALAEGIGTIDRRAVIADRWWGSGVGSPGRLRLYYTATMPDDDPMWSEKICQTVRRRLLGDASVADHDRRRRRLTLLVQMPAEDQISEPVLPVVERAEAVVGFILGEGSTVRTRLDGTGQNIERVDVAFPVNKAWTNRRARNRAENDIAALLGGHWRFGWDIAMDTMHFERRGELLTFAPHLPAPITAENERQLAFAVDEDQQLIAWDMRGAHMLVAGRTGTGKTVLMRNPITEAARRGWMVLINDPKRIEYLGFQEAKWPNVAIVSTTTRDMIATIWHVHEEMERRYRAIEAGVQAEFTPILIVQDEYMNFCRKVASYWASIKERGMPTKCPVFDWIFAILEMGRTADIHFLMGTQRPDATIFANGARDNFSVRASCGPLSPQGAMMMWDTAFKGVAVPRNIRGRGTAVNDEDVISDIQVLWTPDPRSASEEDWEILRPLWPTIDLWPQMSVRYGEEHDLDGAEVGEWGQLLTSTMVDCHGKVLTTLGWSPTNDQTQVLLTATKTTTSAASRRADNAFEPARELPREDDGIRDEDHAPPGLDEDYGDERHMRAERIEPGDLVLVDEGEDVWAVIAYAAEDPNGDVCLTWVDDDGNEGDLVLESDESVVVRRPLEPVEA